MNKRQLIQVASAKSGKSQTEVAQMLSVMLETISDCFKKEESITIKGFGSFSVRERIARKGINPVTKSTITIPASKVVRFKASKKA